MLVPANSNPLEVKVDDLSREVQSLTVANGMLRTELEKTRRDLRHAKNLIAHIQWSIKVGYKPEES